MSIRLKNLLDHKTNVYELTVAMIKRAAQLTITSEGENGEKPEKLVAAAVNQVAGKKVDFKLGE